MTGEIRPNVTTDGPHDVNDSEFLAALARADEEAARVMRERNRLAREHPFFAPPPEEPPW